MTQSRVRMIRWVVATGLAICIVLFFAARNYIDGVLKKRVRSAVPNMEVSFSGLTWSLWNRSITIDHLSMHPLPRGAGTFLLEVDTLTLASVDIFKYMHASVLQAGMLSFRGGTIHLHESDTTLLRSMQAETSRRLKGISITRFSTTGIRCNAANSEGIKITFEPTVAATSVHIDSLGKLSYKTASVSMPELACLTSNYQYRFMRVSMNGSSEIMNFYAGAFRSVPRYSRTEFARRLKHQTDRIEAEATELRASHVSLPALRGKKLIAGKIEAGSLTMNIYRDRRLPRVEERQPMPGAFIRQLSFDIHINALEVRHARVSYEEQPNDGGKTGTLVVSNGYLRAESVLNKPGDRGRDSIVLFAKGSLMGSGSVRASMIIPLRQSDYHLKGAIEKLALPTLNDAAENLGSIHIKSGLLDSLGFDFRFDDQRSIGKIVGIYHGLIIQPLRKGTEKNIAGFRSFMLRHVIIPLDKGREVAERKRTGKIDYRRDPTRKFSFYMLQSLLTGIKSSFHFSFLLPK